VGPLLLTDSIDSYIRVSAVYTDGDPIYYSIVEGNNRETGLGTYISASDSITRDLVYETLDGAAYDNATPSPLSLNGESTVGVYPTVQALTSLLGP
jgi:hypothetical protein